ncbi:MAG: hypothetical protein IT165_29445 [Bryobacterales bacterium]|nr:hypothetical protein [Bryobacterales bacterium]
MVLRWTNSIAALGLVLGLQGNLFAETGSLRILQFPGEGATWCLGTNPRGEMVGEYFVGSRPYGFHLSGDTYTRIDYPGSTSSYAFDVNARGDIVGTYNNGIRNLGFLYQKGIVTSIEVPGSKGNGAQGINPSGDNVGWSTALADNKTRGFLLREGIFYDILVPGASSTSAFGISPQGDIVGNYGSAGKIHGFLLSRDGVFTTVDFPDARTTNTTLYKMSAPGDVAGTAWLSNGEVHGFLWKDGVLKPFDYPGSVGTMVHGINSEGEFCGMVKLTVTTPWGGFAWHW